MDSFFPNDPVGAILLRAKRALGVFFRLYIGVSAGIDALNNVDYGRALKSRAIPSASAVIADTPPRTRVTLHRAGHLNPFKGLVA